MRSEGIHLFSALFKQAAANALVNAAAAPWTRLSASLFILLYEFPHHPAGMLISSGGCVAFYRADRKHPRNEKARQDLFWTGFIFHQNVA